MQRLVILGCGTNVGKTRVGVALLQALERRGLPCLGLKPIESGVPLNSTDARGTDAALLAAAGSLRGAASAAAFYALSEPISPHLAARNMGITIDVSLASAWIARHEETMTSSIVSDSAPWSVVETAGGVFSPLNSGATNFDLARALEPATWVLVAADALGVLHDVSATLQAMVARGRPPDHVVLSAARPADASTGRNAAELATLGIVQPSAVLARDDDRGIEPLVERLLNTRITGALS